MFKIHRRRFLGSYEAKLCKVDDSLLYFCYSSVSCSCRGRLTRRENKGRISSM